LAYGARSFARRFKFTQKLFDHLILGVEAQDGILHIHSARHEHAIRYLCSATDPKRPEKGPGTLQQIFLNIYLFLVDANPVELRIRRPDSPTVPQVISKFLIFALLFVSQGGRLLITLCLQNLLVGIKSYKNVR
jgi:hypothetical protein